MFTFLFIEAQFKILIFHKSQKKLFISVKCAKNEQTRRKWRHLNVHLMFILLFDIEMLFFILVKEKQTPCNLFCQYFICPILNSMYNLLICSFICVNYFCQKFCEETNFTVLSPFPLFTFSGEGIS